MELNFKNVATATVEIDENAVAVNGKTLSATAVAYLIHYGLKQSLADSYASAKTAEEKLGMFNARLDKIISGEMTIGAGGGGKLDPIEKLAREMASVAIRKKYPDAKADVVRKAAIKHAPKFHDAARKQIAALAKADTLDDVEL